MTNDQFKTCFGGEYCRGFLFTATSVSGIGEEDISGKGKTPGGFRLTTVRLSSRRSLNLSEIFYLCSSAKSDGEKVFSGEWLIALFTLAAMDIVFDCLK
ncbi:hypothetical protein [Candidatus Kuenenia sp.]|uniref:hypothetical protein n=1 Tax=Candidatus Kuenenia sp. TaxID=2499824 RepID=UPI00322096D1